MSYTIAEAKANWDSLLSKAEQGQPQVIMRRKREVAMVVSIDDWHEMVGHQELEATSAEESRPEGPDDKD